MKAKDVIILNAESGEYARRVYSREKGWEHLATGATGLGKRPPDKELRDRAIREYTATHVVIITGMVMEWWYLRRRANQ